MGKPRGSPQAFPLKLYEILSNETADLIMWSEDGKSFVVTDSNRFASEVLTKHFKHGNNASFQRQLNLYGFRKEKRGALVGYFSHPCFSRGRPELVKHVRRAHGTAAATAAAAVAAAAAAERQERERSDSSDSDNSKPPTRTTSSRRAIKPPSRADDWSDDDAEKEAPPVRSTSSRSRRTTSGRRRSCSVGMNSPEELNSGGDAMRPPAPRPREDLANAGWSAPQVEPSALPRSLAATQHRAATVSSVAPQHAPAPHAALMGEEQSLLDVCEEHHLSADDMSFALGLPGGPMGGGDAVVCMPGGDALDLGMDDDACDVESTLLASNEPGGGGCPNGGGDTINGNSGGGDAARVYKSPHIRPSFSGTCPPPACPPPTAAAAQSGRYEYTAHPAGVHFEMKHDSGLELCAEPLTDLSLPELAAPSAQPWSLKGHREPTHAAHFAHAPARHPAPHAPAHERSYAPMHGHEPPQAHMHPHMHPPAPQHHMPMHAHEGLPMAHHGVPPHVPQHMPAAHMPAAHDFDERAWGLPPNRWSFSASTMAAVGAVGVAGAPTTSGWDC